MSPAFVSVLMRSKNHSAGFTVRCVSFFLSRLMNENRMLYCVLIVSVMVSLSGNFFPWPGNFFPRPGTDGRRSFLPPDVYSSVTTSL